MLVAQADTEIAWRLAAAKAQGSIVEAGAESDAFLVEVSKYSWYVRSKCCAPGAALLVEAPWLPGRQPHVLQSAAI